MGRHGAESRQKLEHFAVLWDIAVKVFVGNPKATKIYFIDAFAGLPYYEDKEQCDFVGGSTTIAQNILSSCPIDYEIISIDIDEECYYQLAHYNQDPKTDIILADSFEYLDNMSPLRFGEVGWVYLDTDMSVKGLQKTCKMVTESKLFTESTLLDIVLYIGPAHYKRSVGKDYFIHLDDVLGPMIENNPRKHAIIRRPMSSRQYTFIILTNYDRWALGMKDDNGDPLFVKLNSKMGEDWFFRICKFAAEINNEVFRAKKNGQLVLPGLTGLMENTCATPNIELLERKRFSAPTAFANVAKWLGLRKSIT